MSSATAPPQAETEQAPADPTATTIAGDREDLSSTARPVRRRHPLVRQTLMVIRRSHLYFGLLLVPWALLYGVTGYLFNHPSHFSDQPMQHFGPELIAGTALASLAKPDVTAEQVVKELNVRFGSDYKLMDGKPAGYAKTFVFANLEQEDVTVSLLFEANGSGGTMRQQPRVREKAKPAAAPFAVTPSGPVTGAGGRSGGGISSGTLATDVAAKEEELSLKSTPIRVDAGIEAAAEASLVPILERLSIDVKKATKPPKLTSVPDLQFQMADRDQQWDVRYNAFTGSVSGLPVGSETAEPLSWRRFMTKLHMVHGYPSEAGARWIWAVIVDIMAFVMVFWGVSGLVMWWQIKATRPWGTAFLVSSFLLATYLGIGMNTFMKP